MMRHILALSSFVVLSFGSASLAAEPPTVTLSVVIDTTTILVDDPLLLKAVLRNNSKEGVWVHRGFDSFTSGVWIEVCPPESKEFGRVLALDEGLCCGIARPWELGAGKTTICYAQLFHGNVQGTKVSAFSSAGNWQVRMVSSVDGKRLRSEPVTVLVAARPKRAQDALSENMTAIHFCFRHRGFVDAKDLDQALEIRESLGSSLAGRAITEALVLRALKNVGAARARTLVMEDVKKYRDGLGPVAREDFDLSTAGILLDRKEYEGARKILDPHVAEPDYCIRRNQLLYQLLSETQK